MLPSIEHKMGASDGIELIVFLKSPAPSGPSTRETRDLILSSNKPDKLKSGEGTIVEGSSIVVTITRSVCTPTSLVSEASRPCITTFALLVATFTLTLMVASAS